MAVEAKSVKATDSVARFFREIRAEFRKITWASKDEVFKTTGIVLTTVVLFTLLLWLYDSVFGKVLSTLLELIK
jgi:preprotein translocase subunit SecE